METPEQYTDTNIQHCGGCPDCERYERQIDRMNANESLLHKELLEAREENKLYREALTELKRFAPSLSRLADDHLQYPVNCNRALANIETVLSKFQPKKDESKTNGTS